MRSAARKSGRPRPTSASITPTSVTRGKSWPLAIICVPTSTSVSPASNAASTRCDRAAPRGQVAVEALDARRRAARPCTASTTFSVP